MRHFIDLTDPELASLIQQEAVGVIPTDTLYGIVASIKSKAAIERVYHLRDRDPDKACIILVGARDQIEDTAAWRTVDWHLTKRYWPGPFSIIVPITKRTPPYLHRGNQTLAYRVPQHPKLRVLLNRVGPLIAPTANIQAQPPATTIAEAEAYFGDDIDFYVDNGYLSNPPSTLIKAKDDSTVTILRQGTGIVDPVELGEA